MWGGTRRGHRVHLFRILLTIEGFRRLPLSTIPEVAVFCSQYLMSMIGATGSRALSALEIDQICAAFHGPHRKMFRAIMRLGQYTGYRISEILSLRVNDVFDGTHIRASVTVNKAWMKGKRADRTMPIHPTAKDALLDWIRVSGLWHPCAKNAWLFPGRNSIRAFTPRAFFAVLHAAAESAGVEEDRLGTQSLRKSFASALWDSPFVDRDLAKMAKLLGHANPANTVRYLEFLDGSLEAAVMGL